MDRPTMLLSYVDIKYLTISLLWAFYTKGSMYTFSIFFHCFNIFVASRNKTDPCNCDNMREKFCLDESTYLGGYLTCINVILPIFRNNIH